MSQKLTLRTFFNQHPVPKAWRPEMLQLRKDFEKLLSLANAVFEGPVCALEVFDSLPGQSGVELPAIRLSYPNGAKLEFFDSVNLYSVSVTSPDKDIPERLMKPAYRPDIDWSTLYRPGMPEEMCYPSRQHSPRQFTFKAHAHEPAELQKLVLQFSWLQKQAMGLTKIQPSAEAQPCLAVQTAAQIPTPAQRQASRPQQVHAA